MNLQRVLIGVAGAFAVVMLAFAGYIALGVGSARDLTNVKKTEKLANNLEQIKTDVVKNLIRAKELAKAVREARQDVDVTAVTAFVTPAGAAGDVAPEPVAVVRMTGDAVRGVALSPEGNMAVIDGDVYREGDWYGALKIVVIHEGGVTMETARGERREMALAGWSQKRKER